MRKASFRTVMKAQLDPREWWSPSKMPDEERDSFLHRRNRERFQARYLIRKERRLAGLGHLKTGRSR